MRVGFVAKSESAKQQKPLPLEPEFLTVRQVAEYLNVSLGCVYRLCTNNRLAHYTFGDGQGAIRIKRTDLLAFVQGCRIEPRQESRRDDTRSKKRGKRAEYVYKHLDFRPEHTCGFVTQAGTPCTRMTKDDRCYQHQA